MTVVTALCACLVMYPVALSFSHAFMRRADVIGAIGRPQRGMDLLSPPVVSLEQLYGVLMEHSQYLHMFINSLWLTALIAVFHTLFALSGGYVLAKVPFRGRGLLFFAFALLTVMPLEVSLFPTYIVTRLLRLYNSWWAIILPGIFSPLGVFMMRQFILNVPDELCEEMRLESRGSFAMLFYVIAPCVRAGMITLFVIIFAEHWNMVEQPLMLLSDPRKYPLSLVINRPDAFPRDLVYAAALVFLLPVGMLYMLVKEQIIDGLGGIMK